MTFYLASKSQTVSTRLEGTTTTVYCDTYIYSLLKRMKIEQITLHYSVADFSSAISITLSDGEIPSWSKTYEYKKTVTELKEVVSLNGRKLTIETSLANQGSLVVGGESRTVQISFTLDDSNLGKYFNKVAEYAGPYAYGQTLQMTEEMLSRLPGGMFYISSSIGSNYFLYEEYGMEHSGSPLSIDFSTGKITINYLFFAVEDIVIYYDDAHIPYVLDDELIINYNGDVEYGYILSTPLSPLYKITYGYQLLISEGIDTIISSQFSENTYYPFSEIQTINWQEGAIYFAKVIYTYKYTDFYGKEYEHSIITESSNRLNYRTPPTVRLKINITDSGELAVNYNVSGVTVTTITKNTLSYTIYRKICDTEEKYFSGSSNVSSLGNSFVITPNPKLKTGEYYYVSAKLKYYWSSGVGTVESQTMTTSLEKLVPADNSVDTLMKNIADAIRRKTGYEYELTINNMINVLNEYESYTGLTEYSEYDQNSVDSCIYKLTKVIRAKLWGPSLGLYFSLRDMPGAIDAILPSNHEGCDACESYTMSLPDTGDCYEVCTSCDGSCDGCQDCQTTCQFTCQGCEGCESCDVCQGCMVGDGCGSCETMCESDQCDGYQYGDCYE